MRPTEALRELTALQLPVVSTAEATKRLQLSPSAAVKALNRLAEDGLITKLRQGDWIIGQVGDPRLLAPYLTAPYPSYISTQSALAAHGMLDQIPKSITVVSLDRADIIETSIARFAIHHIHPTLFGGFVEDPRGFALATPEKALFDTVYLQSVRGTAAQVEIELADDFDATALAAWCARIPSARLRTMTVESLQDILADNHGPSLPPVLGRAL